MLLVGISGKRGSGKDLLASLLVERHGYCRLSFAEELKRRVREDFGLTKEQTDGSKKEDNTQYIKSIIPPNAGPEDTVVAFMWTPRDIMIEYGQFFRKFDPNYWVNKVFKSAEGEKLCVSDVRFKNEADYIKKLGGIVVRLERKPELNVYGPNQIDDVSETDLDSYDFDLVLDAEDNINKASLEAFADYISGYIEVI